MANPQPKGKGKVFTCQNDSCKRDFIAGNSLAKYCSTDCRTQVNNTAAQVRRVDRAPRECKWCKQTFSPAYGDKRKVFCSKQCNTKEQYKSRSGSSHRRRIKRYGCASEPIDRFKIFERDGWHCYICGKPTPIESLGTQKHDAPEQDHVVALSQGGSHTYDNIKCACRACNSAKAVGERKAAMAAR